VTGTAPARPPLDRVRLEGLPDWSVKVVDAVPSTNAYVADLAREGAPERLVVVAEHQTHGRGRLDRVWETPARSALTVSILLRPTVDPERWPWLPLVTGLAVADAVPGGDVRLKWPNDVLVGEKKAAGILVERVETPDGPAAVVGAGANVTMTEDELPVPTATSLALEGIEVSRDQLLVDFVAAFDRHLGSWADARGAAGAVRDEYVARCATIGQDVRVGVPSGAPVEGRAVDIDPGGRLVVETAEGRTAVGAGDVVHVRPAG
jgi:BirA family biotin operon repressor/biotin-[acetyl-CoA-carboxylase] ligase